MIKERIRHTNSLHSGDCVCCVYILFYDLVTLFGLCLVGTVGVVVVSEVSSIVVSREREKERDGEEREREGDRETERREGEGGQREREKQRRERE